MARKNRVIETIAELPKLKRRLSNFLGADVGFLKETTGPQVYPGTKDWNLATNAALHEHGSPANNIPPRPFMREGVDRFERDERQIGGVVRRLTEGGIDPRGASNQLGVILQGHIQMAIRNGNWAPLDPKTIRRKGSSKPLIDSGKMRQGVDVRTKD